MFSQAREVEKEVIIEKVSKPKQWTPTTHGAMRPRFHTTAANKTTLRSRYITLIIEKGRKVDYRILTTRSYQVDLVFVQVITSCCYTSHARTSQPSRLNLGLCQYRTWTLVIPKVEFQRQYYRRNVSTHNLDDDSKSQQLSERGKRKDRGCWGHGISVHRRNPGVNRNKLFISCKWSLFGWRPSWTKSERLWINKPAIPTVEQERS